MTQHKKVSFTSALLEDHRLLRTSLWSHIRHAILSVIATAPLIYSGLIPFILLDCWVALYQAICFPVYGIPRVRRADYLIFDRAHLAYLNGIEKAGCVYCSYANGLLPYVAEMPRERSNASAPSDMPVPFCLPTRDINTSCRMGTVTLTARMWNPFPARMTISPPASAKWYAKDGFCDWYRNEPELFAGRPADKRGSAHPPKKKSGRPCTPPTPGMQPGPPSFAPIKRPGSRSKTASA